MGPAMLAAAGVCAWVNEATCSMPSACKWRRLPSVQRDEEQAITKQPHSRRPQPGHAPGWVDGVRLTPPLCCPALRILGPHCAACWASS